MRIQNIKGISNLMDYKIVVIFKNINSLSGSFSLYRYYLWKMRKKEPFWREFDRR